LNDHEIRQLRTQMRLLQRRLRREIVPVSGLSRTAMQVLGTIERLPDGSQPRQVADELRLASSNVAAALRELEQAGLVQRERDPDDGRRARLSVTPAGAAAVVRFRNERDSWLGQAVQALLTSDEQRTLFAAGDLVQRLSEYEPTRPGATATRADS
jgi:DNA-binding MarR family transcriptional regulator